MRQESSACFNCEQGFSLWLNKVFEPELEVKKYLNQRAELRRALHGVAWDYQPTKWDTRLRKAERPDLKSEWPGFPVDSGYVEPDPETIRVAMEIGTSVLSQSFITDKLVDLGLLRRNVMSINST